MNKDQDQTLLEEIARNTGASVFHVSVKYNKALGDGRNYGDSKSVKGVGTSWDGRRVDALVPNDNYVLPLLGSNWGSPCDGDTQSRYAVSDPSAWEAVALQELLKYKYPEEAFTERADGWRDWFGSTITFQRRKSQELTPIFHRELVRDGTTEPASLLSYHVKPQPRTREGKDLCPWRFEGRTGRYLTMDLVLPEELALRTFSQVQERPRLIRSIVEYIALHNLGFARDDWYNGEKPIRESSINDSMRPPYERMDQVRESPKIALAGPKSIDPKNGRMVYEIKPI